MTYDVIIAGGGPAGCSAAMVTAQSNYKTLLIHRGTSQQVADYKWLLPGVAQEIRAPEWLAKLQEQAKQSGAEWLQEAVSRAALGASSKQITVGSGKIFEAPVVLLASGCHDRQGLIEGEGKFSGRGVSYNAIQDGNQFKNKLVALEGKGEPAAKEALFLSRFVEKLYFIIPAARLEGSGHLLEQIKNNPKIECFFSASLKKIGGENEVNQVTLLAAGEEKTIPVKAVFLYARIGKPAFDYLKGTVEISEQGHVKVDEQFMTSIPGVFACGDILAGQPQMAFVAAAQGLVAGLNAVKYLINLS